MNVAIVAMLLVQTLCLLWVIKKTNDSYKHALSLVDKVATIACKQVELTIKVHEIAGESDEKINNILKHLGIADDAITGDPACNRDAC